MLVLAALLAANPLLALDSYRSCVSLHAVELGDANSESADTILRAVRSICEPQWQTLYSTAGGGLGSNTIDGTLLRWRIEAEDAAVAALLKARAKRP